MPTSRTCFSSCAWKTVTSEVCPMIHCKACASILTRTVFTWRLKTRKTVWRFVSTQRLSIKRGIPNWVVKNLSRHGKFVMKQVDVSCFSTSLVCSGGRRLMLKTSASPFHPYQLVCYQILNSGFTSPLTDAATQLLYKQNFLYLSVSPNEILYWFYY